MKIATADTYEVRVYFGGRVGYDGRFFLRREVHGEIRVYQKMTAWDGCAARVSPTTFLMHDYEEDGFEVALINYPRRPNSRDELRKFACGLAQHLLAVFEQHRVSVVTPEQTYLFDAETDR